jgi:hypothetical protein
MTAPTQLIAVASIVYLVTLATAQDSSKNAAPESAETIFSIYKSNVQQARTASYTASLDMFETRNGKTIGPTHIDLRGWLDRNINTWRMEYRYSNREWNKLVQAPSNHLFMAAGSKHITRNTGQLDFSQAADRPFDIWLASLAGQTAVFDGENWEKIIRYLESGTMRLDPMTTPGHYHILFRPAVEEPIEVRITFDRRKSMMPVAFLEAPVVGGATDWDHPYNRASSTWEDRGNGVFVPKVLDAETFTRSMTRRITVSVEWDSVNEPIPEATFTPTGMNLASGTHVVDRTLGPPIVEKIVGRDVPESLLRANRDAAMVVHPARSSRITLVLIWSSGVLLVIFVAFRFFRMRTPGDTKGTLSSDA